jgi:hypothetical protein
MKWAGAAVLGAVAVATPLVCAVPAGAAVNVQNQTSATGSGSVAGSLGQFEAGLGSDNAARSGAQTSGFRDLNWDAATPGTYSTTAADATGVASLNATYANERGALLSTPGTAVEISSTGFKDIDPSYPSLFAPFSAPSIFAPIGSTTTTINFVVPGDPASNPAPSAGVYDGSAAGAKATVGAFGVVFLNVEIQGAGSFQFLAPDGSVLATFQAPSSSKDDPGFVGIALAGAPVAAVRLTTGTTPLAAGVLDSVTGSSGTNLVALDDIAYAEPVPGPSLAINPIAQPTSAHITVTGTSSDPLGATSVSVNGKAATVAANGTWSAGVDLANGVTPITATVSDSRAVSNSATLSVSYPPPAPPAGTTSPTDTTSGSNSSSTSTSSTQTTSSTGASTSTSTSSLTSASQTSSSSRPGSSRPGATAPTRCGLTALSLRNGVVTLEAGCDQSAVASFAALLTIQPAHKGRRASTFKVSAGPLRLAGAHVAMVTMRIPSRALKLLSAGRHGSARFTLNVNGRRLSTTTTKLSRPRG